MLLELLTAMVLNSDDINYFEKKGYTYEQIDEGKGIWYGNSGKHGFGTGNLDGPCGQELPYFENSESKGYDNYYGSQAAQQSSPANSFSAGSNS